METAEVSLTLDGILDTLVKKLETALAETNEECNELGEMDSLEYLESQIADLECDLAEANLKLQDFSVEAYILAEACADWIDQKASPPNLTRSASITQAYARMYDAAADYSTTRPHRGRPIPPSPKDSGECPDGDPDATPSSP